MKKVAGSIPAGRIERPHGRARKRLETVGQVVRETAPVLRFRAAPGAALGIRLTRQTHAGVRLAVFTEPLEAAVQARGLASWACVSDGRPRAAARFLSGPGSRYTATPDYRRLRYRPEVAGTGQTRLVREASGCPDPVVRLAGPRKRCSSRGAWRDTFMAWRSRTRSSAGFAALARRTRSKPRSTLGRGEGRPTRKTSSPPTDGAPRGLDFEEGQDRPRH